MVGFVGAVELVTGAVDVLSSAGFVVAMDVLGAVESPAQDWLLGAVCFMGKV